MAKQFLNKVDYPGVSTLMYVAINKARSGIVLEAEDYLCYLPIASVNAINLLKKLQEWADAGEKVQLQVVPDKKEKEGFRLRALLSSYTWLIDEYGRYSYEGLFDTLQESEWDLSVSGKEKKK